LKKISGTKTKRILGSNHGGLSLQIAIEQMIPYERQEVGYSRFVELCQDLHSNNDEEIRKQMHQMGIGFNQHTWLNPMVKKVVEV
jgi:valyl-tRNA synthetase